MQIIEELKQFVEIVKQENKKVLPTERLTTEEHLFLANVEYGHFAGLMWSKNQKTVTDSYKTYLLETALEHLVLAMFSGDVNVDDGLAAIEDNINYFYDQVKEANYDYSLLVSIIAPDFGKTIETPDTLSKISLGLAILLMNLKMTMLQFLDHYKTWKLK